MARLIRTQVQFEREQLEALRTRAAREGTSVSEIVRRAVEAWVRAEPTRGELRRRAADVAGEFGSGREDVAAEHDRHLEEAYGR